MAAALELHPYEWSGPYAEMRSSVNGPHDAGLCAEIRGAWLPAGERIILRTSEIVGYPDAFLYDDHFPPCQPNTRGKLYEHIPFQWNASGAPHSLSADCDVPDKGGFSLDLALGGDALDIQLTVRSDLDAPMGNIDWHFCAVAWDAPSVGDPDVTRTFLWDGDRLRSLNELQGGITVMMHHVAGADFTPEIHQSFSVGPVLAQADVVIVENRAGTHSVALGFERSHNIFSNTTNMCFHADPCFRPIMGKGEECSIRGRLYLMAGTAPDALARYREDFGA